MMELLINSTPLETRIACIQDGIVEEIHIERNQKKSLVGSIYKGRVVRIIPGLQAAFVDIGLEKMAYLHVSDVLPHLAPFFAKDEVLSIDAGMIQRRLHLGQELMVQISKAPTSAKGVRVTTYITLVSHYLLLTFKKTNLLKISQRITAPQERTRLKNGLQPYCNEAHSLVVRTAANSVPEELLIQDALFLQRQAKQLTENYPSAKIGAELYCEFPLEQRILRDLSLIKTVESITTDSLAIYQTLQQFIQQFVPEFQGKLQYYTESTSIFERHNTEQVIQSALRKKVPLCLGGYLIIEQTEAMVVIDINSGSFVGQDQMEAIALQTNLEAAIEIARQLRLRNLSGIILIDFIDMSQNASRTQVLQTLRDALRQDSVTTMVGTFSPFGLLEVTRQRTRESLEQIMCDTCSACKGYGRTKSILTVCLEIEREIAYMTQNVQASHYQLYVSCDIAEALLNKECGESSFVQSAIQSKQVTIESKPQYSREQFDIVII